MKPPASPELWRLPRTVLWGSRIAAWIMITAVLTASLLPADVMPEIGRGLTEHFAAYLAFAVVAALGYGRRLGYAALIAVALGAAGLLELAQLLLPGRTPSWTDFSAGAAGAAIGMSVAHLIRNAIGRPAGALAEAPDPPHASPFPLHAFHKSTPPPSERAGDIRTAPSASSGYPLVEAAAALLVLIGLTRWRRAPSDPPLHAGPPQDRLAEAPPGLSAEPRMAGGPPPVERIPASRSDTIRNRLLGVLVALLIVAGLKWSYPVTMPLAVAAFIIAVMWPIKPWLDKALPSALSYVVAILILFLIFAGFFATVWFAVEEVVQTLTSRQGDIRSLIERYIDFAEGRGLPTFDGEEGYNRLVGVAQVVLSQVYSALAYLGLIAILIILGLPETPAFQRRLRDRLRRRERGAAFDAMEEIGEKFRQYVGVSAFTSLLTGVASAAWAYALGLELALIWGLLNFLLNFIPVIGNIIGIIPPTLYAVFQFQNWTMPLITFAGYAVIQIAISNFIYPMLQGAAWRCPRWRSS